MEKLVVFCILMENNGGIEEKSPQYIKEKFEGVMEENFPVDLMLNRLNFINIEKYNAWNTRWDLSKDEKNNV